MKRLALLLGTVGLALGSRASAQGFNIDINSYYGTPVATFGAGAGQPGVWNAVPGIQGTSPLVDLNGAATAATITCVGANSYDFQFNNALTSGDDEKLMDDASDPTSTGATWTITGVAPGNYILYTYAWAPDSATYFSLVSVAGSPDPAQSVGGTWTGTYTQGLTHAVHHITVAPGGSVGMSISVSMSFATLNGFQLKPDVPTGTGTNRCEPGSGGVIACPCSNPPSGPARGCDNSSATGGASIAGSGSPSVASDTLSLTTAGEKPSATSIVLQGTTTNATGLVFGQGIRCVTGALKRLYTQNASSGSITVPPPGGPSISARSAALGDPITAGQNRWYLVYYRDPIVLGGCPSASTFNCTFTLEIAWQ
jgi:hypothetical protein